MNCDAPEDHLFPISDIDDIRREANKAVYSFLINPEVPDNLPILEEFNKRIEEECKKHGQSEQFPSWRIPLENLRPHAENVKQHLEALRNDPFDSDQVDALHKNLTVIGQISHSYHLPEMGCSKALQWAKLELADHELKGLKDSSLCPILTQDGDIKSQLQRAEKLIETANLHLKADENIKQLEPSIHEACSHVQMVKESFKNKIVEYVGSTAVEAQVWVDNLIKEHSLQTMRNSTDRSDSEKAQQVFALKDDIYSLRKRFATKNPFHITRDDYTQAKDLHTKAKDVCDGFKVRESTEQSPEVACPTSDAHPWPHPSCRAAKDDQWILATKKHGKGHRCMVRIKTDKGFYHTLMSGSDAGHSRVAEAPEKMKDLSNEGTLDKEKEKKVKILFMTETPIQRHNVAKGHRRPETWCAIQYCGEMLLSSASRLERFMGRGDFEAEAERVCLRDNIFPPWNIQPVATFSDDSPRGRGAGRTKCRALLSSASEQTEADVAPQNPSLVEERQAEGSFNGRLLRVEAHQEKTEKEIGKLHDTLGDMKKLLEGMMKTLEKK